MSDRRLDWLLKQYNDVIQGRTINVTLGSGRNLCTALMLDAEDGSSMKLLADFYPPGYDDGKLDPSHIPGMELVRDVLVLLPAMLAELQAGREFLTSQVLIDDMGKWYEVIEAGYALDAAVDRERGVNDDE